MIDQAVYDLTILLEKEKSIYEGILNLEREKTNILINNDVSKLTVMTKTESTLVLEISRLETSREEIVFRISKLLNICMPILAISELKNHLDDHLYNRIKLISSKIKALLSTIKNVNELNSKLIKNSLDHINFSINLVTAVSTNSNNYINTGELYEVTRKNLCDFKR